MVARGGGEGQSVLRRTLWACAVLVLCVAFLLWGPPRLIEPLAALAGTADLQLLLGRLRSYWPWTPLVILCLMVVEAMVAPIPLGPIVAANVLLFGFWGGMLISWVGALVGAAACYGLARAIGRERIARMIPANHRHQLDRLSQVHGFGVLVGARFVPVANSVISYVAGLGSVAYLRFLLASALGLTPWILLYSLFAQDLFRAGELGYRFGLGALLALGVYATYRYAGRRVAQATRR